MAKRLIAAGTCFCAALALCACVSTKSVADKPVADKPAAEKPADAKPAETKDAAASTAAEGPKILDNFEDGNFWAPMENTGALIADVTDQHITDGEAGGIWEFKESGWTVFQCRELAVTDWTGYTAVSIDLFSENPGNIGMQFIVMATDGWDWQQSIAMTVVEPGKQLTLTFPIVNKALNSSKKGVPVDIINGVEDIKYVGFAVLGEGAANPNAKAGKLYVDKITLVK